jgi:hypothetical protein
MRLPTRVLAFLAAGPLLAPALVAQATVTDSTRIKLPGAAAFDGFGRQVLVDGDELILTANSADTSGAAYSYRRVGGAWTRQQEFRGSDTGPGDFFGFAAARAGELLVVGADQHSLPVPRAGAAYVFERQGGSWVEVQKLSAPSPVAFDGFGWSVAIAGDLLVVGATGDDQAGTSAGAAYVFRPAGASWGFEQKLLASTGDATDEFGWAVATDGEAVVVSAVTDEQGLDETGAAFVFEHNGIAWSETQRIVPGDAAHGDRFGWDVAFEPGVLLVSATDHDSAPVNGGAVYVYGRSGAGWSLDQKLVPSKVGDNHAFGWSMALDGNQLAVGAATFGAIYTFHHNGAAWVEVLQCDTPGGLGASCDIDGKTLVGGDPWIDALEGAAHVFTTSDLGLDAVPDKVPLGGTLDLETYGGLPGGTTGLFTLTIGGVPVVRRFGAGVFDGNGKRVFSFTAPPSLAGLEVTFVAAGPWANGLLGLSNVVTVTFE